MKGTLFGAYRSKGNFTNEKTGEVKLYDNLQLVLLVPFRSSDYFPEGSGMMIEKKAKCRYDNISAVFGDKIKSHSDLIPFFGNEINFYYDANGNLAEVVLDG